MRIFEIFDFRKQFPYSRKLGAACLDQAILIFLQRKEIFSLLQSAKTGSEAHQASSLTDTRGCLAFAGCISAGA